MKLYAISDLHLDIPSNWAALVELSPHPDDWLIVAGDVAERVARFTETITLLARRFARVFWTPGNHDLWTLPKEDPFLRGLAKYNRLVDICRERGVATPEDPFVAWPGDGPPRLICPTFTLYDYSFRPGHVPLESAVSWAAEENSVCTDEVVLHPDPFPSRQSWCAQRCRYTEERLKQVQGQGRLILANHYPLMESLVTLRRIPRFSLWCGSKQTADWPTQFEVETAVYGHLHIRNTTYHNGVRFEEVSLGYPRNWRQARGMAAYLRQILPIPQDVARGT